jgi:hypothetical protein
MGKYFFDQYTILHFAVGIIAYFWNVSLLNTLVLHTLFELLENTEQGMYFINTYFKMWPGGKPKADTLINSVGDTVGIIAGWIFAQMIDKYSEEHHLYK